MQDRPSQSPKLKKKCLSTSLLSLGVEGEGCPVELSSMINIPTFTWENENVENSNFEKEADLNKETSWNRETYLTDETDLDKEEDLNEGITAMPAMEGVNDLTMTIPSQQVECRKGEMEDHEAKRNEVIRKGLLRLVCNPPHRLTRVGCLELLKSRPGEYRILGVTTSAVNKLS